MVYPGELTLWYRLVVTSRPLVSVVTPSYNYGQYIGACLESVRRQRYPEIEHIVLDARSTDATRDVVRSFEGTYRLTARFEADDGQADALNKGFRLARGEVLCWLNADDYWIEPSVIEEAVAALEQADVVTGGGWYVDAEGRRFRRIRARTPREIARDLAHFDVLLQPATFWRREVHRALRTDLHYAFDWALFREMQRGHVRFATVARAWAAYRWTPAGKTASDAAGRRGETARLMLEEFGPRSAQYAWARMVHRAYALAEQLPYRSAERLVKRATYWANVIVAVSTRNRICSW